MDSVQELIRLKLQAALEAERRKIASGLLSMPTNPPIPAQGPIAPASEAFSRTGRPADHKPTDNAGERRQKLQLKIMKDKQKVQKIQSQVATSKDARGKNADLQIARTQMSLDTQKLAKHR